MKSTALAFLALVVVAVALTGCSSPTSDPYIKVRSPLWGGADPVLMPQGYAIPVQTAPQYVTAPQYATPNGCAVPNASAPYQYAPPPSPYGAGCR